MEAVRPRGPVRGMDRARRRRPRSVEDAGRRRLRHRAGDDRARQRPRAPPRGRAVHRQPAARLLCWPPAPRWRCRRRCRCTTRPASRRADPRADAASARCDGDRARRPEIPVDGGAALHRLGRVMGACASDIARARAHARDRRCAVRIRARVCGVPSPAARCWAWAPASRFSRPDSPGPSGSPSPPLRCRIAFAKWRTRRYAIDRCGRARRSRSRSGAHLAARALAPRARCTSRHGGRRKRPATSWRRSTRRRPAIPLSCSRTCRGSRGPRCRSSLWTIVTRGRGFNGGLATAGVQLSGTLALVIGGLHRGDGRPASRLPHAAAPAAGAARGARDRHACRAASPARSTGSAFSLSAFSRSSSGGCGSTPTRTACRPPSRGSFATPRPATARRSIGSPSRVSLFLTVLWLAPGAPRAPLESAHRSQLGGGNDAALGALLRRSGCPISIRGAAIAPSRSRCARALPREGCVASRDWATRSAYCSSISPAS